LRSSGEIQLTLPAIREGSPSPIPFEELMEVAEATFAVEEAIAGGKTILMVGDASGAEPR
jgi:hypothetical protein